MKKHTIASIFLIGLASTAAFAEDASSLTTIEGNPVAVRKDYTINGNADIKSVTVECKFINNGWLKPTLNVWTSPKQTKPVETIQLKKGRKSNPFIVTKTFKLDLKKTLWCPIYTPHPSRQWAVCAYFSISDARIAKSKAFSSMYKVGPSSHTRYSCHIKTPDQGVRFFSSRS